MGFPQHPRLLTALFFSAALVLRGARLLSTDLAPDAAISGVMGLAVLRGEFPLFFYGQKFMGTADVFLSAPLYLLLGPSTLTANLLPLGLSLLTLWTTFLILHRLMGSPGRHLGLLSLAVPTAFGLYCLTDGKSFYHLSLFFSALLLWFTLELEKNRSGWIAGLSLTWGILAGLALWTNLLSVVTIAACGMYLLLRIKASTWLPSGIPLLAGVILGALPVAVFAVWREAPGVGWLQPGTDYSLVDRLSALFSTALPIILGINPRDPSTGLIPGSPGFLVYLFLLIVLSGAAVGLALHSRRYQHRGLLLPPLILLATLGAVLLGGRPEEYRTLDQRYLLPLYLGLPFCWGFWADRFSRQKIVALILGFLVLGVQGYGYTTFKARWPLLTLSQGHVFALDGRIKEAERRLRSGGLHEIFNTNVRYSNYHRTFLSGGDPVFCNPVAYEDTRAVARVGASLHLGYRMPLDANFRLLGIPYRLTDSIYHAFSSPRGVETLLDSGAWKAVTLEGKPLETALTDGDLETGFVTRGTDPDGQGFIVDLGREETIGGLALIPKNYQEVPAGLQIEAAGSGGAFRVIRQVRGYTGPFYLSGPNPFFMYRYPRLECYFDPQPLRYLRLTQLGRIRNDWPVRELLVFGSRPPNPEMSWAEARDQLLRAVALHPLKNLYADAWPSCVMAASSLSRKPGTLLPTIEVDIYGSRGPAITEPLLIDPAPGNGLLVGNREAAQAAERLTRSEIRFTRIPAGNYTLFLLQGRRRGPTISIAGVSSETDPTRTAGLSRGHAGGERWSSGGPQRPGIGLTLDLGGLKEIGWISLHSPHYPRDYPRGLSAVYSPDGTRWTPLELELVEPLAFSGRVLLLARGPRQHYRIRPAVTTRYIRFSLNRSDPVYWWSVEAIGVAGPSTSIPGDRSSWLPAPVDRQAS